MSPTTFHSDYPESTRELLHHIAGKIVRLTPGDRNACSRVEDLLTELAESPATPSGISDLAWQAFMALLSFSSGGDGGDAMKRLNGLMDAMLKVESAAVAEGGGPGMDSKNSADNLDANAEVASTNGGTSAEMTGLLLSFTLPGDIDLDLVREFRAESAEHFQDAEVALMNLENDPADAESVNTVFRAFHTVKGVSSFVGISCITELAHKAETLLDKVRKGQLMLQGACTDMAFESLDQLKGLLAALPDSVDVREIKVTPAYHELLRRLESAEASESHSPAAIRTGKVGEILVQEGKASPDDVDSALERQAEGDLRPVGEILVEQLSARAVDVAHAIRKQQPEQSKTTCADTEGTVKVNTARLDSLINLVGELASAQSMVSQDPLLQDAAHARLAASVDQLSEITGSLQKLAFSMRMVSVKALFQKMARLVRDLARKSHKEIVFEMYGADTELDRNMVEAIADPLVHMVRNAADHGVESPDDRVAAGKPRHGRIILAAFHEEGSVVISLKDDGRGLNTKRIREKAIERGLMDPNSPLDDAKIHKLIFLPGFSTAKKVTDVSGRGVGMDVVQTNIEALRGTVDIASVPGQGTTFRIQLPPTLEIIDGMVVRVDGKPHE